MLYFFSLYQTSCIINYIYTIRYIWQRAKIHPHEINLIMVSIQHIYEMKIVAT